MKTLWGALRTPPYDDANGRGNVTEWSEKFLMPATCGVGQPSRPCHGEFSITPASKEKIENHHENKFAFAQGGFLIRRAPRETRRVLRNGARAVAPLQLFLHV